MGRAGGLGVRLANVGEAEPVAQGDFRGVGKVSNCEGAVRPCSCLFLDQGPAHSPLTQGLQAQA